MPKPTKNNDFEDTANILASTLGQVYANNTKGYTKLLDLLADGKPISIDEVANSFQYPKLIVQGFFRFVISPSNFDFDNNGNIIGSGLTLKPTSHRFRIRENDLYTWCALDTLLFPLMLNESAQVQTTCPITNTLITFTMSPEGITGLSPQSAVISIVVPTVQDAKANIRNSLCQFANMFKDKESAMEWKKHHPESLILSAEDAFELSQKIVKKLFLESRSLSGSLYYSLFVPRKNKIGFGMLTGVATCLSAYLLMKSGFVSSNPSMLNLTFSFLSGVFGGYSVSSYFSNDNSSKQGMSCS